MAVPIRLAKSTWRGELTVFAVRRSPIPMGIAVIRSPVGCGGRVQVGGLDCLWLYRLAGIGGKQSRAAAQAKLTSIAAKLHIPCDCHARLADRQLERHYG